MTIDILTFLSLLASVGGAVGTIIWVLLGRLESIKTTLTDKIDASSKASAEGRDALSDKLTGAKDDLGKAIADSRHDLRSEFNARFINFDLKLDKLILDFTQHAEEDRGWFRAYGDRIARLETRPKSARKS